MQWQAAAAPAKRVFTGDAGMVLNFIKADKTADFEAVMTKLKEALAKSDKPERKQQAAGWKVFKSPDPAGANVLFVFIVDPSVKGADYQISVVRYFGDGSEEPFFTQEGSNNIEFDNWGLVLWVLGEYVTHFHDDKILAT